MEIERWDGEIDASVCLFYILNMLNAENETVADLNAKIITEDHTPRQQTGAQDTGKVCLLDRQNLFLSEVAIKIYMYFRLKLMNVDGSMGKYWL